MTKEEVRQLKPGADILIRAKYKSMMDDDDVSFLHSYTSIYDEEIETESFTHPSNIILPSELQPASKYDPCRKLKKGDKVKPRTWRDRVPSARLGSTRFIPGQRTYEVFADELHSFVKLICGDEVIEMHVCHLELVTPVEELEPFFVYEDATSWQVKRENKLCCRYGKATHPHAKEAAEAECARLNAEHRKEQNQ